MGNVETQRKLKDNLDQMFSEQDKVKQCNIIKSLLRQVVSVDDLYIIVTENLLRSKKDLQWHQFVNALYSVYYSPGYRSTI